MDIKFLLLTALLLFICAYSDSDEPFKAIEEHEISGVGNAASAYDINLGLTILWVSDTTLAITHKSDTVLNLNESDQYLQFNKKQSFKVVLKELTTS